MKRPDLVRYTLRGTAGDEKANEELELGAEVLVVLRGTVTKLAESENREGQIVDDCTVSVTAGVVLAELPATIRKQLTELEAARLAGEDRLPI